MTTLEPSGSSPTRDPPCETFTNNTTAITQPAQLTRQNPPRGPKLTSFVIYQDKGTLNRTLGNVSATSLDESTHHINDRGNAQPTLPLNMTDVINSHKRPRSDSTKRTGMPELLDWTTAPRVQSLINMVQTLHLAITEQSRRVAMQSENKAIRANSKSSQASFETVRTD